MTSPVLRPRFFEGQYLSAEDLAGVVDYARVQDSRHMLGAHTWGIAIGLHLKEVSQGGQLQVFVQAGYAWDGFGRPIVVLAPYAIPADLFKAFVYDPASDEPNGRLVTIWLRYREANTTVPAEGFEVCNTADQNSRVQETFVVEIGDRLPAEQDDNVDLGGNSIPAAQAFQAFDATDPLVYDESIPQQTLPATGRAKWLIPLGYVRWKPSNILGQPGSFQQSSDADKAASTALRIPIGAIAGAIQAAEGALRLKDRFTAPSAVISEDLVWVEGPLRVEGDARLFAGKLALVDSLGSDQGVPLTIQRTGDGLGAGRQLRAEIGVAEAGQNSFQIGPTVANAYKPVVTVLDNGAVGIGTAAPAGKLEIRDGDLLFTSSAEDAGDIVFQNSAGAQKARVWSNPAAGAALFLSSGDLTPDIAIDANGLVGIGTTTPDRAVTVQGAAGTYLNVKANAGAQECLIGADTSGAIVSAMTNHDLQLRAGSNATRMIVKTDGKVGIGTTAPARQLHVVGDRIRLESNNKSIDMRTDGGAVDLQSETNDLYLRSSGAAGNNDIIMNPFGTDGNVGVGLETPVSKLHVQSSIDGPAAQVESHVALIDNASTGSNADVLALRIGRSQATSDNNYITFFAGSNASGRIEGNGAGGVSYLTTGADFAESLPQLDPGEILQPGDVVGIVAGKITRRTNEAHHVSAITARPAVVANAPMAANAVHARVAMIGQVPVRVRGSVNAGDLIVPSGAADGTAIAMTPDQAASRGITMVVGTAWETSRQETVKPVNTAIGLPSALVRLQQAELNLLRSRIAMPKGKT